MSTKIILTTIDNGHRAEDIAEKLLKEKLAACVSIVPIMSHYWWRGKIERSEEFEIRIKTKEKLVDTVLRRIKQLHNYELPVIDVINVEKSSEGEEKWIDEVTK
ncbi:MAG: divalent-cation tolerance protein CutA [Candidatus Aenigmarchaeota archaeon]|nr:divalent-cation tolerance protein CutA [Candidatus Aenigmarchaeota archaeon]